MKLGEHLKLHKMKSLIAEAINRGQLNPYIVTLLKNIYNNIDTLDEYILNKLGVEYTKRMYSLNACTELSLIPSDIENVDTIGSFLNELRDCYCSDCKCNGYENWHECRLYKILEADDTDINLKAVKTIKCPYRVEGEENA